LRRVDTIEIEPAMVEGAKAFGKHTARAFDDPRSHIDYDDAKAYFASRLERYDIIISEPSIRGVRVGGLFSKEFYEFIPRHLNPAGCSCSGSSCTRSTKNSSPRSGVPWPIVHRFPRLSGQRHDAIIMATAGGSLPELNGEIFRQPGLGDELRRVGLASVEDLRLRQVGDRQSLLPMLDLISQRTNSDFFRSCRSKPARALHRQPGGCTARPRHGRSALREVIGTSPRKPGQFVPNAANMPSRLAWQAATIAAG
jgi:hypothetical protein